MSQVIRYKSINIADNQSISRFSSRFFKVCVTVFLLGFITFSQGISKNTNNLVFLKKAEKSSVMGSSNEVFSFANCDSLVAKFIAITADTQCIQGNSFEIKNMSFDSSGQNLTFGWYVNSNLASTDTNFQYTFVSGGIYKVDLIVQNDSGCKDTVSKSLYVEEIHPIIEKNSGLQQCLIQNNFAFTDSTQSPISYSRNWKLNQTTISNSSSIAQSFNQVSDSLNLTLELVTPKGCIFDTSLKIKILANAKSTVIATNGKRFCDNIQTNDSQFYFKAFVDTVLFNGTTGATIVDRYWLFDGIDTIRNESAINFLPTNFGSHSVAYRVKTSEGCLHDTTFDLVYSPKPKALVNFVDSVLCLKGNRFELVNTSQAGNLDTISNVYYQVYSAGHIDTFYWNVGDPNTKFSMYDTGTFKVQTTVITNYGCIDSSFNFAATLDNPLVQIISDKQIKCFGDASDFNLSRASFTGQENYLTQWYSNQSLLSSDTSIVFSQNVAGQYPIKLTITSNQGCVDSSSITLTVLDAPKLKIQRINFDSCVNNDLRLKGIESNGQTIKNYLWKFPDGTQSTDSVVSKRFLVGGLKEVQLIAEIGPKYCIDKDTLSVQLFSASKAKIYTPKLSKCSKGNLFTLRDSSSAVGSITKKVKWNFADGTDTVYIPSTNFTQVKHSYANSGKFNVALTITNQYGCVDSTITQISVNPTPTSDFTIDNNTQCLADNIFNFSDRSISNSINNSLNYYWNFGDSSISSTANPIKKYTKDGQKNIKFIVSNAFGCSDTSYSIVQVMPQPVANFGVNNALQCVNNNNFIYTDSSKVKSGGGVIKLSWDFGDGSVSNSSSVTKKYTSVGLFKTKLFATTSFGCVDSIEKNIRLMPKPKSNYSMNNDTQCFVGNSFQFYNTSSIVTGGGSLNYQWAFGDGNTSNSAHPNISYSSYGNYSVKLKTTSQYGCVDSLILPVLVTANPLVSFQFLKPQNQCNNTDTFKLLNTTQTLNGTGLSYKWDLGDATFSTNVNVQKSYLNSGSYFIKLIATNSIGCVDSSTKQVQVFPDPTVDFSVNKSSQCIKNQNFQFINNSSVGFSGGTLTYSWKYSDTQFSTATNTFKTFNTVKTYPIKLIARTSNGCSDSITKNIQVFASPKADFAISNSNQCLNNNQYKFTNNSFINVGTNSYNWSYGDGLGSGLNSPSKTYTSFGSYRVLLTATSDNGCVDTFSKWVRVFSQPSVSIQKSDSAKCLYNNQFDFASLSSNADNSGMNYYWTFGTAGTDTGKTVQKSFSASGIYLIKLVVHSGNGCKDSNFTNVKIHPQPLPSFNLNNQSQCLAGNSFSASNLSSITGGSTLTYGWKFGNGKSDVSANPSWSYLNSGTYTVTLYANSVYLCTDSIKKTVIVNPNPNVMFSLSDTAQCLKNNDFVLNNQSSISNGTLYHSWDFGNLQKSNGLNPSVSYAIEGIYKIKLVTRSSVGCADSMTKQVTVYAQPKASFAVNSQMQCLKGNYFQFTNGSTVSQGALTYKWSFGDSSQSTLQNPMKSYNFASNKLVKLIATSNKGCKDSMTLGLAIKPNPKARFYVNDSIQCLKGNDFIFYNNSTLSDGKMVANWNFGDNSIQSNFIGRHTFVTAGYYKVLLTMITNHNCSDTVSKLVKITEQPIVLFSTNQSSACFKGNVFKTDNSSVYNGTEAVNYLWRFSDGTSSTQFGPVKSFDTDGQKSITLIGTTTEGCADSFVKKINVYPQGKSLVQFFDTIQCLKGNKFTFGNQSRIEGEKFAILSWDFGDGTIDTVLSVKPVTYEYYDTGLFRVELTTTTENLCEDKSYGFVRVVPMPDAKFSQSGNSYCQNDQKFEFWANPSPSNIVSKKWILNKKVFDQIDTLKYSFDLPGKYKVNYIQTTNFGCSDTATSKVIVNEAPLARILSDKIEQCLETNKFYFTNLSSGNSVPEESWIFHDGPFLDLRTGSSQELVYEYSGKHLVELIVENDSACIDTASTYITVNPFPEANIQIPSVCQNISSLIRANASIVSGNIATYEWNLGDGRNTNDSLPIHRYNYPGKYYVNLTLKSDKGCISKHRDSTVIYPNPIARIAVLTPRATILQDTIHFMDSSDNAVSYEWYFGDAFGSYSYDLSPKNRYTDTGDFNVQLIVTSADGCTDTTSKIVRVWPDFNLLFPTAFSPNLDGTNDDYNVVGHFHSIKDFSMTIFDAHGLKVFETNEITQAWNGTLMNNGNPMPSGNYEVIVRVRDLYNKQFSFTKKISLIR